MKLIPLHGRSMLFVILCSMLFFPQACKRNVLQPDPVSAHSLSIAEAKKYFEANVETNSKSSNQRILMASTDGHNHEPTMEDILIQKEVIWESAYQLLKSTGNVIKIPMNFGHSFLITDEEKHEVIPYGALNYLMMYKDSLAQIHTEWVTLVPDKQWLYGQRSEYYGSIEVKTWDGKVIKQFTHLRQSTAAISSTNVKKMASTTVVGTTEGIWICISTADPGRCTCPNKAFCDHCWQCMSNVCKFSPAAFNPPIVGGGTIPGGGSNGGDGFTPPGNLGGGPDYPTYVPPSCNSDPNYVMPSYPAPAGTSWMEPCGGPGSVPYPSIAPLTPQQALVNLLELSGDQALFVEGNSTVSTMFNNYLIAYGLTEETKSFTVWGINYLMANPQINPMAFRVEFLRTTELALDPDAVDWSEDPDNQVYADPDQTVYQPYQDNQQWPTIERIIPFEKFVPIRRKADNPNKNVNCLVLAKEQLGKVGYTCSGYLPSGQTFSTYTAQNGVDLTQTKKAISYIITSLGKNIPVLIGVDNRPGAPRENADHSTDHYVVVVGMGTDSKGKYFQFMDSATDNRSEGASFNNRLYYDSSTGKITGKTAVVSYRNQSGMHDYIVTQVRKSIKK